MANAEQIFNELGINAITAVELMDSLNISVNEISMPQRFQRLQTVVEYLKNFPTDTQRYLIKKACYGKQVDKLDHMFEYTNLLKSKFEVENTLKEIKAEKSAVSNDMSRAMEIALREKSTEDSLFRVKSEIEIYER